MKTTKQIEGMFTIKEGHTPKILIGGGTNHQHFAPFWENAIGDKKLKDMDSNASRMGLPLSPLLVLLVQGEDNHIDAILSLPLQKWQGDLALDATIEATNDLKRITDWCAGFLDVFCMDNTVSAVDLATNKPFYGDPEKSPFGIEKVYQSTREDVRGTGGLDIGSVDEILGQVSQSKTEKVMRTKKAEKKEIVEEPKIVEVKKEKKDILKEQQEIVKKYGYAALKEMADRMNMPILVQEPK